MASGVRHSAPPPKPTSLVTFLFGDKKVTPPHARTNTELFRSMQHFPNRDIAVSSESRPKKHNLRLNSLVGEDIILPPGNETECLVE